MTTSTIPTIRNRYPELFVGRPRPRFLAEDERVHTARKPICEDRSCGCWPALLGDNAWKMDGTYRARPFNIGDIVGVVKDVQGQNERIGQSGTLEKINEHNEDGDFYGVRMKHDNALLYFWQEELQVIIAAS